MISHISIRDFKSIRNQEVDLAPLTVLVGRSGSGKSNFAQATRFLRNYLRSPNDAANVEGGWQRIVPAGEQFPKTEISVRFSVPSQVGEYEYSVKFAAGKHPFPQQITTLPLVSESLSLNDKCCFAWHRGDNKIEWITPPALAVVQGLTGDPMLGRLPAIQEIADAHTAISSGIGYYSFPNDVLSSRERSHGARNNLDSGLADDASNYLHMMRDIAQDYRNPQVRSNIIAVLKKLNTTIAAINLDSLTSPSRAEVGHSTNGKILSLNLQQESDGFRRFYAHLLALYQVPPKLVNVIEEPENGIYPGALELLAEEFKASEPSGRGQVVLTTHSPTLLDHIPVECLRVFELRTGQTVIGPVSNAQQEAVKEQLLTCGELLSVDPARVDDQEVAPEEAGA